MASIARKHAKRKVRDSNSPRSPEDLTARLRRRTPLLGPDRGVPYADQVLARSAAEGRARDALYFLANHADEAEEVEMGQQTLSEIMAISPSQVAYLLRKLRKLGELIRVRPAGWGRTNRYRIVRPDKD